MFSKEDTGPLGGQPVVPSFSWPWMTSDLVEEMVEAMDSTPKAGFFPAEFAWLNAGFSGWFASTCREQCPVVLSGFRNCLTRKSGGISILDLPLISQVVDQCESPISWSITRPWWSPLWQSHQQGPWRKAPLAVDAEVIHVVLGVPHGTALPWSKGFYKGPVGYRKHHQLLPCFKGDLSVLLRLGLLC